VSYILDALKKSDSERQQRQGPTMASVQQPYFMPARRPRTSGALLLGGVVTALLGGLYQVGYLKFQLPTEAAGSSVYAEPKAAPPKDVASPEAIASIPAATPSVSDKTGMANFQIELLDTAEINPLARASAQAIPELWQLPGSLREGIPPLDFSLHVYSTQIEQRSIIINNRMMREGEFVSPELALSAITPDGVVMRYRSEYFRVSIVDSW
jgi:general secretion pathway protein B